MSVPTNAESSRPVTPVTPAAAPAPLDGVRNLFNDLLSSIHS
jgi:hypothetical protein